MLLNSASAEANQTLFYSPSEAAPLAPCWGPHPLQNCHSGMLSGILRLLSIHTSHSYFIPANPLKLFGLAMKKTWKFPQTTSNLQETEPFIFKLLKFEPLFQ